MSKRNTGNQRLWAEPATKQSNNDLYPLVALGDEAAREQMIRSNVGLVMWVVDQFLVFMPGMRYLRDDLIASGIVGLVEAVNKMATEGFVDNADATTLMSLRVRQHLGKAVEAENMIRVPDRTRRRKKDQGVNLEPPRRVNSVNLDNANDNNDLNEIPEFYEGLVTAPVVTLALSHDPRQMQELRSMLDACCENDIDREILRLRELGHVDREIAQMLDLPLTTTYVMRRTLYARFLELSGYKGEA